MPAHFIGPLDLREVGYEWWMLLADLGYETGAGELILAPQGMFTDLASVPHLARSIVPKIGYWSKAAVIHDRICWEHREGINTTRTRKQGDDIFKEAIGVMAAVYNIPDERRKDDILYFGVRMGGLASWETGAERKERLTQKEEWFLDQ